MATAIDPWDRQSGESTRVYHYFAMYRDLGPTRSIAKLAKAIGSTLHRLEKHSKEYGWSERAASWDDFTERERRDANRVAIIEMADRQAKLAMALQNKVLKRLQSLDPDEMSPRDLAQMFDIATRVEREVRGLPAKIALTSPDGEKAWSPVEVERTDELERVLEGFFSRAEGRMNRKPPLNVAMQKQAQAKLIAAASEIEDVIEDVPEIVEVVDGDN